MLVYQMNIPERVRRPLPYPTKPCIQDKYLRRDNAHKYIKASNINKWPNVMSFGEHITDISQKLR